MGKPKLKVKKKVTATDILLTLTDFFPKPEWLIGYEVGNSTGAQVRRHADAVVINTYPSKNFEIRGFEIKVSKQDLKKELENGAKADEIAKFCHYWFLVTPKDLTKDFIIPEPWGIYEYHNDRLKMVKKPLLNENVIINHGFMCGLLRGRERYHESQRQKLLDQAKKAIKEDTIFGIRQDLKDYDRIIKSLKEVKEKTGIDLISWSPSEDTVKALKTVINIRDFTRNIHRISMSAENLKKDSEKLGELLAKIDFKE